MKQLLETIAKLLVDHPEVVAVTAIDGMQSSIMELRVAKDDIGKVIGKQGRTADALRTILNAVSAKEKKRAVLEIIDQP